MFLDFEFRDGGEDYRATCTLEGRYRPAKWNDYSGGDPPEYPELTISLLEQWNDEDETWCPISKPEDGSHLDRLIYDLATEKASDLTEEGEDF